MHKKDYLYLKENYFSNDHFTCQITNHKDSSSRMRLSAVVSQKKSEIPSEENVKDIYQDLCPDSLLSYTNLNQE